MISEYVQTLLENATCHVEKKNLQNINRVFLSRAGSKINLAQHILPYFPPHITYMEPFFGAGGMYFSIEPDKLKANNVLNDLDGNVINLFNVLSCPVKVELFVERLVSWVNSNENFVYARKYLGDDPVERAVCYYIICNNSFGHFMSSWNRRIVDVQGVATKLKRLHTTLMSHHLPRASFMNKDFRSFFDYIDTTLDLEKTGTFIYADPPYIGTDAGRYYDSLSWSADDLNDLIEAITKKGFEKFMISERLTDITEDIAKKWGLQLITIKGDCNAIVRNRQEILLVSYPVGVSNLQEKLEF